MQVKLRLSPRPASGFKRVMRAAADTLPGFGLFRDEVIDVDAGVGAICGAWGRG